MTLNLQKFPESHSTALPCINGNHRTGSYNRVHSRTMIDYWITSRSLETFFGSFSMKFFCALLPSQFFVLFCWRLFFCPHSKDSPVQEIENQFSKLNWKIVAGEEKSFFVPRNKTQSLFGRKSHHNYCSEISSWES